MEPERKQSFPCVICGRVLLRDMDDYEAQPREGVMCSTHGNYGSTVYDPVGSGEYLAFNICDPCLVEAGERGRLFATHSARPVKAYVGGYRSLVGWQRVAQRPYVPWYRHMPDDGDELVIDLYEDLPEGVELNVPLEDLRAWPRESNT